MARKVGNSLLIGCPMLNTMRSACQLQKSYPGVMKPCVSCCRPASATMAVPLGKTMRNRPPLSGNPCWIKVGLCCTTPQSLWPAWVTVFDRATRLRSQRATDHCLTSQRSRICLPGWFNSPTGWAQILVKASFRTPSPARTESKLPRCALLTRCAPLAWM